MTFLSLTAAVVNVFVPWLPLEADGRLRRLRSEYLEGNKSSKER